MEITVQKYAIIIKLQKSFPETRRRQSKSKVLRCNLRNEGNIQTEGES